MGILSGLSGLPATVMKATLGHTVVWRVHTEVFDPATGNNTLTATDHTVTAMAEDYPESMTASGNNSESGIVRGDRRVSVPASEMTRIGVTPSTEDKVRIGSVWHSVKSIDADPSPIEPLTWTIQARR